MSIVLERWEANIDNLAVLSPGQQQQLQQNIRGLAYAVEEITDVLFIGCRRKVGDEQRRPGPDLYFNGVIVDGLLVSRLRRFGLFLGVELDDGNFGIPILPRKHFDTIDGAALKSVSKKRET